jgi:amino acid transporter
MNQQEIQVTNLPSQQQPADEPPREDGGTTAVQDHYNTSQALQQPDHHRGNNNKLTLLPLVFLIYFEVAGGPYGAELAVRAAGPLFPLLVFLVFPFAWGVLESLVTAELAAALPGNGGFVLWADSLSGRCSARGSTSAAPSTSRRTRSSSPTTWAAPSPPWLNPAAGRSRARWPARRCSCPFSTTRASALSGGAPWRWTWCRWRPSCS